LFSSFHQCLLLADRSLLREMGSGLRDRREHFGSSDILTWLLVITLVSAVLLAISRLISRNDSQRLFNNPQGLFRALCHAHQLDRSEQRLLMQMAKVEGVSPAMLFLSPTAFTRVDRLAEFTRPETAATLAAKLFAGVATDMPARGSDSAAAETSKPKPPTEPSVEAADAAAMTPSVSPTTVEESVNSERPRSAPSLFQPAPPTIVPGPEARGDDAAGSTQRVGRGEEHSAVLTEQQAMRALQILMQQIRAERAVEPRTPIRDDDAIGQGYRADETLSWQPSHNSPGAEVTPTTTVV
jgi:hypothetical protein